MKRFHDFAAAKKISAYVVIHPERGWVATIRAHHGEGVVHVECVAKGVDHVQLGRAGGYGYDKLTAAMAGFSIDGHTLSNHCQVRHPLPEGLAVFPRDLTPPRGYTFANLVSSADWGLKAGGLEGWQDCYKHPGLDYLTALGYDVRTVA